MWNRKNLKEVKAALDKSFEEVLNTLNDSGIDSLYDLYAEMKVIQGNIMDGARAIVNSTSRDSLGRHSVLIKVDRSILRSD